MSGFIDDFLSNLYRPNVDFADLVEILIIAFVIYQFILLMQRTKAWTLLKGLIVILAFILIASIFNFTTILWIAGKSLNVAVIALVIIFQQELRKALAQLGNKRYFAGLISFDNKKESNLTKKIIDEIVSAVYYMASQKTGALIVIEQDINLADIVKDGIDIDAIISAELLINIFEHNTPLHDGAVIIRENRIASATCYLPSPEDQGVISKELGTRHRAAIGVSENTDAFTIVVSEETGAVSIANNGKLIRNVDRNYLDNRLNQLISSGNTEKENGSKFKMFDGKIGGNIFKKKNKTEYIEPDKEEESDNGNTEE